MTAASGPQIVPARRPLRRPCAPPTRAWPMPWSRPLRQHPPRLRRQWRLFNEWCDDVGLPSLPAEPLTVARYLAVRAGDGASIATCASPPPPSPRSTSGPAMNRLAGTGVCAPL